MIAHDQQRGWGIGKVHEGAPKLDMWSKKQCRIIRSFGTSENQKIAQISGKNEREEMIIFENEKRDLRKIHIGQK